MEDDCPGIASESVVIGAVVDCGVVLADFRRLHAVHVEGTGIRRARIEAIARTDHTADNR